MKLENKLFQDEEISFGTVRTDFGPKPLLVYPHACGIMALEKVNNQTFIYLVEQYRLGSQKLSIELPAGKLKKGETEIDCAKRELQEEAGLSAEKWQPLVDYYPAIGISTERIFIFEATALHKVASNADDDEEFTVLRWPIEKLEQAIYSNEIKDGKTILAFQFWQQKGQFVK